MSAVERSAACLRIGGDELNPVEVSRLLQAEPSLAFSKGEVYHFKTGSSVRKTGMWLLKAAAREPADLDAQIFEIFDRLPHGQGIWDQLARRFEMDVFVGLFMRRSDEGISVRPETLKLLGERGIRLELCLYGPSGDED